MEKYKKSVFLQAVCPVVAGGIIYYLFSPEVIFVKKIDAFIGTGYHLTNGWNDNILSRFVRFYFLDILWAYSLCFALFLIMGNNTAELSKVFGLACVLSVIMEVLQKTPYVKGTFDGADILFEVLAEIFAVFIIKKYAGGTSNEKENQSNFRIALPRNFCRHGIRKQFRGNRG